MLDTFLIVARAALVGVFAVAAVGKALDQDGSREAMHAFGVPRSLVGAGAAVLPVLEALAAGLLIVAATARLGAAITAVLLVAFIAGIARALSQGRAPACHCFGQISSQPAGRETLLRNVVLLAVALFVLVGGPGPTVGGWLRDASGEQIVLAALLLAAGGLAAWVATLHAELARAREGTAPPSPLPPLPIGEPLPAFEVRDGDGARRTSEQLAASGRSLFVFTSATCEPCHAMLPELSRWARMLEGRLAIHVVASGDEARNRQLADQHDLPMFFDADAKAFAAVRAEATPSGLEVGPGGTVASPVIPGSAGIEALIRGALRRPEAPALTVSLHGAS